MPKNAAEKAEFLAGLDEGLRQIAEGKLIPHEEVKTQFNVKYD